MDPKTLKAAAARSLAKQQNAYAVRNRTGGSRGSDQDPSRLKNPTYEQERKADQVEDRSMAKAENVAVPVTSAELGDLENDTFNTLDFTSGRRFGDDDDPFNSVKRNPSESVTSHISKTPLGTTRKMSAKEMGAQLSGWLADRRGQAAFRDALHYAASSAGLDPGQIMTWGRPDKEKFDKLAPSGGQSLSYTPIPED